MKVYIAGKVSELDYNEVCKKFTLAEHCLIKHGHEAVNPMKLVKEGTNWVAAMGICIDDMLKCEAVFLLPDWGDSTGARLEALIAERKGLVVTDRIEGLKIKV